MKESESVAERRLTSAKARDLRVRSDNPASGVRGPERGVARSKTYLYPSEFTKLVSCSEIGLEFRQLYAVAVLTAARAGEIEALTWSDIDLERGVIHITKAVDRRTGEVTPTKSGETRRIAIHPRLRPLLEALSKAKTGDRVLWMPVDEDRAIMLRQHLATAHHLPRPARDGDHLDGGRRRGPSAHQAARWAPELLHDRGLHPRGGEPPGRIR